MPVSVFLLRYLKLEMSHKQLGNLPTLNLKCLQLLLPRQNNNFDCGLYTLLNIECLLKRHEELLFYSKTDHAVSQRILHKLFPRELVTYLRANLKCLFMKLMDENCTAL